ncbi:alpha-2-macroglobulin family protein [Paucidesulfovibrio longus]|uniref:alpha-2-macroglobulin family protein n=1 Tax=Paucidesulfovibrio longus TaxID=889 RepID=UPI0003B5B39D|nr:MG2 domain-containing protein [Paucidesulfovibrio longus]
MNIPGPFAWLKNIKNIAILALSLVVAVETGLLVMGPGGPAAIQPDDPAAITVSDAVIDLANRQNLTLEFSFPLGREHVGEAANATAVDIAPDLPGQWIWTGAYSLTYKAEEPFRLATEYELTLHSEALTAAGQRFTGERTLRVKTGSFMLESLDLRAVPSPAGPTMITLEGTARFNAPVDPEALLKAMTLTDPHAAKPLEISALTGWRSREISFRSAPLEKMPEARDLTLTVSADLTSEEGNIPLGRESTSAFSVVLDPVLRAERLDSVDQGDHFNLRIGLSTAVDPESAADFVRVTPETDYRLTTDGNDLILRGDFLPGSEYAVQLRKGLTAIDGAVLGEDWSAGGVMPDLAPGAEFADEGMFLSLRGARALSLETVNTDRVDLTVDRVYRNNLFWLFADYGWMVFDQEFNPSGLNYSLGDRVAEKTLNVPAAPNRTARSRVDLGRYIDGKTPGFYRVGLTLPGSWWGKQRWVLVTDLGIAAKRGADELLVWVNSFSTLAPQAGVSVTLRSERNQILARGVTDANGFWRLGGLAAKLGKAQAFMITAEKGNDFSFMLPDRFQVDTTGLDVGGSGFSQHGLSAFIYGERDIYRPGETLEGAAIVRDQHLSAPPALPLTLRSYDPEGRLLESRLLRTDAQGVAAFKREIPDYALTGSYFMQLEAGGDTVGEYRYQVEEFVPDRIRVDIRPASLSSAPGQNLDFSVEGRYLFGPPAADLDAEARVTLRPLSFAPRGYENFAFGDPEKEFPNTEIFAQTDGKLDDQGRLDFSVKIPKGLTPPAALEAYISARVREHGGRGVSGGQGVPVHAYPRYPGLALLDRNAFDPGEPVDFRFVLVSPDGAPAQGKLQAAFYKDEWQTVVRRTPSGGFRYESSRDPKLLERKELSTPDTTAKNGPVVGDFKFTPEEFGSYRVTLTDPASGASTQLEFYCGGWGYSPWAMENPARIEIVPDKEEYKAGERATFQLRTPFAGKALVTVESRDILETHVVDVVGNTAEVSFPAKSSYAPNVYISAMLLRKAGDLAPGEAGRAFGSIPFNVDRAVNRLDVALRAPEEVRPGGAIRIEARTRPGSTVTIAAVDEGILRLIAQKTPNPFDFFYAKRRLDVESFDIFSMLFPEPGVEGSAPAGGGEMLEAMADYVRSEGISRVKPVTFWSGPLTADAQGMVRFSAQAPEGFQGALRIMAVAAEQKHFGSGSVLTRIKSPVSATATFPRFLALDERVLVPVTVRNDTDGDLEIALRITAEGPLTLDAEERKVPVPAGREVTVPFELRTGASEGRARFVVSAEGGGQSFRSETELPVRTAYPFERHVDSGSLDSQALDLPPAPEGLLAPTLRRELHVGGLPMIRYSGELRDLLRYPYGCAEQTVSRAFPLLRFGELAQALAPDLVGEKGPAFMVQSALRRLSAMQTGDGGFGFWPGAYEADPWVSVYATHFLIEAKRAGFGVSEASYGPALGFVARLVKEQNPKQRSGLERIAYGLYVLARAGQPDRGMMHYLAEQERERLDAGSASLLAASFAAVGDMHTYEALLTKAPQMPDENRERGGNLGSPLRDHALILLALMDAAPADPRVPGTVEQLTRLMDTGSHTTQENALALMALGAFFERQASHAPFSGKVLVDGEVAGKFSNESALHLEGLGAGKIRIELDGQTEPGAVLYSLETRGAPSSKSYAPQSKGIEVRRSLLDRQGKALAGAVKQGDLLVLKVDVRSRSGAVPNMAVQTLLPTGLEVENPRLATTERLDWMEDAPFDAAYQDLRDDRVLLFGDLPFSADTPDEWRSQYVLVRAVSAGEFTLPPVRVEAMYDPAVFAQGEAGRLEVAKDF